MDQGFQIEVYVVNHFDKSRNHESYQTVNHFDKLWNCGSYWIVILQFK